ncbi:MAG: ATP-binding protein [Clostridiales Family XIII bacterium]|jgi:serine/threonine-protein kinase RsbW|nr:ATP-binding protein [Clostridiales Family XIII bacterium]
MSDTLKLMVPGKPEYVGTVRLAVSSLANKVGFDIEAIEDIKVAVSEACSNIVCHSDMDSDRPYRVVCEMCDDRIEIVVEDEGIGFDTDRYEEPAPGQMQERGLGVFIIRALMDEVNVLSEVGSGTRIKMVKYIASG